MQSKKCFQYWSAFKEVFDVYHQCEGGNHPGRFEMIFDRVCFEINLAAAGSRYSIAMAADHGLSSVELVIELIVKTFHPTTYKLCPG